MFNLWRFCYKCSFDQNILTITLFQILFNVPLSIIPSLFLPCSLKVVNFSWGSLTFARGEQPEVIVHIGTNDISRKKDEVWQSEIRIKQKIKSRTMRLTMSVLFPVLHAGEGKNRRIGWIKTCLRSWRKEQEFIFSHHCDLFCCRCDLYKRVALGPN